MAEFGRIAKTGHLIDTKMAEEKINLFELDIDTDEAARDLVALREQIELLKKQTEIAKKEQGEFSAEYVKYAAALKSAQTEARTQENLIKNATSANVAASGSIDQMRKQLAVVSVQWAALSKEERENTELGKNLTKQKKDLTDALKAEEKATGDTRRNVGNYGEAMQALSPQVASATGAVQKFKGSLDILKAHPIIAVITALVAIIGGLIKAFTSTQAGSDKLAKAMGQLSAIMDVLLGVAAELGEKIIWAFENPKKAVKALWESIKQNVVNRIEGVIEMFGALGRTISAALKLDFDEVKKAAGEAGKALTKATTGVDWDKAVEGARKFKEELAGAARDAARIEDMKVAIRRAQIALTEENAKYVKQIAQLRLDEADRTKSLEERLAATKAANDLEMKRNQAQLDYQARLVALAEAELAATPENLRTDEQRLKIAEERAKLAEMEAQSLNFRRKLTTKISELERQITAEKLAQAKAEADAAIAEMEAELAAEEELVNAKIASASKQLDEADKRRALNLERLRTNLENELAIYENNEGRKLEIQRQMLELQKQQELEMAEKTGADKQLIEQKYAMYEQQLEQQKAAAKFDIQQSFAKNLAATLGQQSKVGKAAAIAATTIETFKGAQSAFSALAPIPIVGPALGATAAGAAVTSGLANVKKIVSTKSGLPGEGGGGGGGAAGGGVSMPVSVAPSIGQGLASRESVANQTDAIKEGVGAALRENPIQPTQVIDSVTAAQSTESRRNETSIL